MPANTAPYDRSSDEYKTCVIYILREYKANPRNIEAVDSLWLLHGIEALVDNRISGVEKMPRVATPFTLENVNFVEAHARNALSADPENQAAARKLRLVRTYRAELRNQST